MTENKRKLTDITLEEAVEVIRLADKYHQGVSYEITNKKDPFGDPFVQLYYLQSDGKHLSERISANFSHDKDSVSICEGNTFFRNHYKIIKYLENRGFDLASASSPAKETLEKTEEVEFLQN